MITPNLKLFLEHMAVLATVSIRPLSHSVKLPL